MKYELSSMYDAVRVGSPGIGPAGSGLASDGLNWPQGFPGHSHPGRFTLENLGRIFSGLKPRSDGQKPGCLFFV